jgi:DNA-binding NarL/FixJ family response regulator
LARRAARLPVMMNDETDVISVFIVAASPVARAGLQSLLQADERFIIAGGAAGISSVPPGFSGRQTPDVLLINVGREKDFDDLIRFLGDITEETGFPATVALVPPEMQNFEYAVGALRSGVRGILPIDASESEIAACVAAAANNLISLPPETMENLLSFSIDDSAIKNGERVVPEEMFETLTAREREVLEMLGEGASNKSIARQLNISEHTVKFHVASIFAKFGVNTRTEAVTRGLRNGLILL